MLKIYPSTATSFGGSGAEHIITDSLEIFETKKKSLNGWYIEVKLPIKYASFIEQDKIAVVKTKSKIAPQGFRIRNIEKTQYLIKFEAWHVMFDAERYFLVDVRPEEKNGINVLSWINERTDIFSPFIFYSDITNVSTAYFIRKNLLEAMTTIERQWGGIFDADNYNISLLQSIGSDNGVRITYGTNLEDIEIEEDWSNVCTRVYPVGKNGIILDSIYVDSIVQYDIPYTKTLTFDSDLDDLATENDLKLELEEKAAAYLLTSQYPEVRYTVKSNINQNLEIGDVVKVLHPLVELFTEVQEYEYNINRQMIESIVFGNYHKTVKKAFDQIKEAVKSNAEAILKQENSIFYLNKLGYVFIDDNEILILDKLPKESAQNVLRIGLGGIGFSTNGYEGPYNTAMTQEGQINAGCITSGLMSTGRIEGLQSIIDGLNSSIELNGSNIQASIIRLDSIDANGVKKLINTLVEINENGIELSKSGEQMNILLGYIADGQAGLQVNRDTTEILGVDNTGVRAIKVATDTLIVAKKARTETYGNGVGVFILE